MPAPKDIEQQQKLLDAHRETLAHYLVQQARLGKEYAPPAVSAGIRDSRAQIARIKAILLAWNVEVEDLPDEDDGLLEREVNEQKELLHLSLSSVTVQPQTRLPIAIPNPLATEPIKEDTTNNIPLHQDRTESNTSLDEILFKDRRMNIIVTNRRLIFGKREYSTKSVKNIDVSQSKTQFHAWPLDRYLVIFAISTVIGYSLSNAMGTLIVLISALVIFNLYTTYKEYIIKLLIQNEYEDIVLNNISVWYVAKLKNAIEKAIQQNKGVF